jgi:hypothetical protein
MLVSFFIHLGHCDIPNKEKKDILLDGVSLIYVDAYFQSIFFERLIFINKKIGLM